MANMPPRPAASSATHPQTGTPKETEQNVWIQSRDSGEKKFGVFRFREKMDFKAIKEPRLRRENNLHTFKTFEDQPLYGAGSEYGRAQKEEARRKKLGIIMQNYNPHKQPWFLSQAGKDARRWKGNQEGSFLENASYFVFVQDPDSADFLAYPVEEWHSFTPVPRYKALDAEEAEEEFGRREKILNLSTLMMRKKYQTDGDEVEDEKLSLGKGQPRSDLLLTNEDDELPSDADDDKFYEDEDGDEVTRKSAADKKSTDKLKVKKKHLVAKRRNKEEQGDSDDGDHDDTEIDYMSSDASDDELEKMMGKELELKSFDELEVEAEQEAEDEEDDEETKKNNRMDDNDEMEENGVEEGGRDGGKKKKKKARGGKEVVKKVTKDLKVVTSNKDSDDEMTSSDSSDSDSSDSEDFDNDNFKSVILQGPKGDAAKSAALKSVQQKKGSGSDTNSAPSSRSATPTANLSQQLGKHSQKHNSSDSPAGTSSAASGTSGGNFLDLERGMKRSSSSSNILNPMMKRLKTSATAPTLPSLLRDPGESKMEATIRRYLQRKPMTTKELLGKLKPDKDSQQEVVKKVAHILKRLNPERQTIGEKMYLSLKP